MNDPFPPQILVVCASGSEATCSFKDVIDGIPRYELSWPEVWRFRETHKTELERSIAVIRKRHLAPEIEDRLTADTNRALDLIGKALEP